MVIDFFTKVFNFILQFVELIVVSTVVFVMVWIFVGIPFVFLIRWISINSHLLAGYLYRFGQLFKSWKLKKTGNMLYKDEKVNLKNEQVNKDFGQKFRKGYSSKDAEEISKKNRDVK
jgi:hypothetical protein